MVDELHEEEIVAPIDVSVTAVLPREVPIQSAERERANSCFGLNDSFGAQGESEHKSIGEVRASSSASSVFSLNDSMLSSTSSSKEDVESKRGRRESLFSVLHHALRVREDEGQMLYPKYHMVERKIRPALFSVCYKLPELEPILEM